MTLFGGTGNDSLRSGSSLGKSPVMYGGPGNDGLYVNNNGGGTPILHGGRGDDELAPHCPGVCGELYGDAGNDRLLAFASADWFDGGPGRDIYAAWSIPWDKPFADLIAPESGHRHLRRFVLHPLVELQDRPAGLFRLRRASDRRR